MEDKHCFLSHGTQEHWEWRLTQCLASTRQVHKLQSLLLRFSFLSILCVHFSRIFTQGNNLQHIIRTSQNILVNRCRCFFPGTRHRKQRCEVLHILLDSHEGSQSFFFTLVNCVILSTAFRYATLTVAEMTSFLYLHTNHGTGYPTTVGRQ